MSFFPSQEPSGCELGKCESQKIEFCSRESLIGRISDMRQKLVQLGLALSRNRTTAEDLAQETLLKASLAAHQFREFHEHSLIGWLNEILRNCYRSSIRKRNTEQKFEYLLLEDEAHCIDFESHADGTSLLNRFESLSDIHKDVLTAYIECRSYDGVAESLGIAVGTAKSRIHRARTAISPGYKKKNKPAPRFRAAIRKAAYREFRVALKNGDLVRPAACERCKDKCKVYGHHHDYLQPLSVAWLCSSCHFKEHQRKRKSFTNNLPESVPL